MASMTRSALHAVLMIPFTLLIIVAACTGDTTPDTHASAENLQLDRPECPQKWDKIPQFVHADSAAAGVTAAVVDGSRALAVVEPIKDIPEFHDCQKFIQRNGAYDALYAIFAVFKLDSVGDALVRDSIRWTSSDNSVAVVSDSGFLRSLKPGTATITAVSTADSSRRIAATVLVKGGLAPPVDTVLTFTGRRREEVSISPNYTYSLAATLGTTSTNVASAAVIYTFGPGNPELGIGPNFNCLYVYYDRANKLSAKMVKVGKLAPDTSACRASVDPNTAAGTELEVKPRNGQPFDLPAVARWDYDDLGKVQYIGIKCGNAWCEIGSPGFHPSPRHVASSPTIPGEKKVLENKGWHDEQFLAVLNTAGEPIPSRLKGTVVPHPDLLTRTVDNYKATFLPVAFVGFDMAGGNQQALAYYKAKFNFDPVPVSQLKNMNKLELCFGTTSECDNMPAPPAGSACATNVDAAGRRWWVRLVGGRDNTIKHRCVIRREHPALPVGVRFAKTARWRWLLADETVWHECTQGCCESMAGADTPMW
jgi:hypothetical protein